MKNVIPMLFFVCLLGTSCSKKELLQDAGQAGSDKAVTESAERAGVDFYYNKNVSLAVSFPDDKETNTVEAACNAYASTIAIDYLGFSDKGSCTGKRVITVSWLVGYPSAPDNGDPGINPVLNANSKIYFKLPTSSNPYPSWSTAPITALNDEVFDEDYICHIPPYRDLGYIYKVISASFTLTNAEYCAGSTFQTTFNLSTDCPSFSSIAPANVVSDNLDQVAYQVVPFSATNSTSGGVHKFTAVGVVPSCSPCHGPTLGLSPTHTFKWRPGGMDGHDGWTSITRTDAQLSTPFDVVVPKPGPYDYKSKGILYTSGEETRYTIIQTVTVL